MKILLIHVSKNWQGRVYAEYPLGIGILATLAKLAGHTVYIHDMAVDSTSISQVVEYFKPNVTGISFLSTSATTATTVIMQLCQLDSGHLVAGGIHVSIFPEDTVEQGIDIAVTGEGELVWLPLLELLDQTSVGNYVLDKFSHIPNLVFRDKFGTIRKTNICNESVNINELPPVDRSVFDLSRYPHHSMITSRGCPYRCKFCCSWGPGGRKGRMASPQKILNELEILVEKYGATDVYWADDMFFFNKKDRLHFCSLLKNRKLPLKWTAQLRADNLDSELVNALTEAGCVKICLGAESGSDNILKSISKGLTREKIEQGILCAVNGGLRVKTWWIVGLPGAANISEHLESISLIDKTRPDEVAIHLFVPLPGTIYWDNAVSFGIKLPPMCSLEKLYFYGNPGDIEFKYISRDQLESVLESYEIHLQSMGYVSTDHATPETKFIYTSPTQKKTFDI